jgi:hypothetical protein
VALQAAMVLRQQVHLEIGHVRASPQVVVAHEAVEVERRGSARIRLDVYYFVLVESCAGQDANIMNR